MTKPYYAHGEANKICDICGFKFKSSQLFPTWDGFLACRINNCWYPKHPFDTPIITKQDPSPVINARPEQPDVFLPAGLGLSIFGGAWISVDTGTSPDPYWDQLADYWENY